MGLLHASFSGYFPFCVPEQSPTGEYPVGLSLTDAMALYWKAKTFRVVESWAVTTPGEPQDTNTSGSTNVVLNTGREDKMQQLVCPPFYVEAAGSAGSFTQSGGGRIDPPTNQVTDTLGIFIFDAEPFVIKEDDLYYPRFSFIREAEYVLDWSSNPDEGQPFYYNATLSINGTNYNLPMFSAFAPNDSTKNCSSIITIESETSAD